MMKRLRFAAASTVLALGAPRTNGRSFAVRIRKNARRTEIVTAGTKKIRSYDLDGKLLWELGGMSSIVIPTDYIAWYWPQAGPYHPSPLVYGDAGHRERQFDYSDGGEALPDREVRGGPISARRKGQPQTRTQRWAFILKRGSEPGGTMATGMRRAKALRRPASRRWTSDAAPAWSGDGST